MKSSIRFFAVLAFLTVGMSLNSFAYSVLCQSLPVSVSTNNVFKPLFTCAIPANAVPTGKALRITSNLHSASAAVDGAVFFNGSLVADLERARMRG
jgi:hypothetical protein